MSGWDTTRRVELAAPWSDFWVEVYTDPEFGLFLDFREAWAEAKGNPLPETIDRLIVLMTRCIAAHNITGRDGAPVELRLRNLNASLTTAIAGAITDVVNGGGEPADPLPTAALPASSSPRRRSRRSSASGS